MRQRNRYDPLPSEDQDLVKVHQPSTIKKKLLNPMTHFLPEQFNLKKDQSRGKRSVMPQFYSF